MSPTYGRIPLTLDRAQAPCTVQSFLHLARHRFYDRTICHRLTAYPTLKVLQCGDPSGTGEGGPGLPVQGRAADRPAARAERPDRRAKIYPRGTLAMANAGPNTNGSQFFLVYADSVLRPNYTIFGTVGPPACAPSTGSPPAAIAPTPEDPAPVDGAPAKQTKIYLAV